MQGGYWITDTLVILFFTYRHDGRKSVDVAAPPESEEDGRLVPQLKIDVDGNIIIDEKRCPMTIVLHRTIHV